MPQAPNRGASATWGPADGKARGVGLYRDEGVVLRTIKLGEADRIVTFLTSGRGKVRAVAKGVRKTKSRFGSRLEPLSHVSLLMYEGRPTSGPSTPLDLVTQADTVEHFRAVREDLDRLAKANSLLEVTDQVAQERQANPRLYQMLLGALRALAAHDSVVLVPAFFLKLLSSEGYHPMLDSCAGCERADGLVAFDLSQGGVLCRTCATSGAVRVSPDGLALVARVLGGDLVGALNEPTGAAAGEMSRLATRAVEQHLERQLRTLSPGLVRSLRSLGGVG